MMRHPSAVMPKSGMSGRWRGGGAMPGYLTTWARRVVRFTERLWVRVMLVAALALVAAGAAALVGPFIPSAVDEYVGAEATDGILAIIASSMLAVTIFSLGVMVQIHRAVSGQWTPRVHRLLTRDRATINVLATFVGAWLFALVSIILRSAAYVGERETVVLFGMTLLVVALIVVMLVRWIAHLEQFGSLAHTNGRIEEEACRALQARMRTPCLGGRPLLGGREAIPWDADEVLAHATGWVRNVHEAALADLGREHGMGVYLSAPVGRFVHERDVIAHVGARAPGLHEAVRRAIVIGPLRSFEQDPRFGLVVLGEVASKALSSGINDAGTAIDVIGRVARVLEGWRDEAAGAGDPPHPHLHVPPLRAADLLEDAFAPIARDGAGVAEVQIHLQRTLGALARHDEPSMAAAARAMADDAWRRARAAMDASDLERVEEALPRTVRRTAA